MARAKMRKFRVRLATEIEVEVSDALLRSCNTDEWRASMFRYTRDEQFVEHIAGNMVINNLSLHSIDGYADQSEKRVRLRRPWLGEWDVEAEELQ